MIIFKTLFMVLLAEMGDKTQLVAMAFASKFKAKKVILGIFISIALLNLLAVLLGSFITCFIPISIIKIVAGILFVVFGLFNLKEENEEENEKSFKFGPIMTVALTFFIGELGDKTQLMTITLSAQYSSPLMVFLGSTLGMLIADSIGIIIGTTLYKKIPSNIVKIGASAIFITFGTLGLYDSLKVYDLSPIFIMIYFILLGVSITIIHKYNNKCINRSMKSQFDNE